jgi:prepilin-type processing-associated H-X9-DG protein
MRDSVTSDTSPISDAWFYRIKAATRDAVTRCGGVIRAGEIARASKTEVSRWQTTGDPAVIPLPAALALEAECGEPLITAVMADLNGRRLADGDRDGGSATNIIARHAGVLQSIGEMVASAAAAFADGHVTTAEAEVLDRAASTVARAIDAFRDDLAAAKGPRVVAGRER